MALWIDGVASTDVYSCFKNIDFNTRGNTIYIWDNWVKKNTLTPAGFAYYFTINDRIIEAFNGGVIWLTSNGDICYRFAPNGKVHTALIAKINLVFSNFVLQYNIFITEVL